MKIFHLTHSCNFDPVALGETAPPVTGVQNALLQKRQMTVLMIQAPNQRDYYRPLFRDMVYAALV